MIFLLVNGQVNISNIVVNTEITNSNPIAKYVASLNGKTKVTISDVNNINYDSLKFKGLQNGINYITLTALNSSDEIIGSMTKTYEYSKPNAPDLIGFDTNTTFYVTWDENGNEDSSIPISNPEPENWYDYGEANWANIVVKNNNGSAYYVWIPRYEYKEGADERMDIKFIQGTSTQTTEGYSIPDAFWWDSNSNGEKDEGEQIKGFWAMKYVIGDIT